MSERVIRRILLTCWIDEFSQEDFYNQVVENLSIKDLVIGGIETTENGLLHFHVYIEFSVSVRFNTIKNYVGNSHIEICKGNTLDNYNYCCKVDSKINVDELCFYTTLNPSDLISEDMRKEEVMKNLVLDIFDNNLNIVAIIKKYPKYAIYNLANIKEMILIKKESVKYVAEEIKRS